MTHSGDVIPLRPVEAAGGDLDLLPSVMHPIPLPGLSTLILANATFGKDLRLQAARDAFAITTTTTYSEHELNFAYTKIEEFFPTWLHPFPDITLPIVIQPVLVCRGDLCFMCFAKSPSYAKSTDACNAI